MGESCRGNAVSATFSVAKSGNERFSRCDSGRTFFLVAAEHAFGPDKTAFALAEHTGVPLRTCYRWLGGQQEPPPSVFLDIIQQANQQIR